MQDKNVSAITLADRAGEYATGLLKELDRKFEYHNLAHTHQVVEAAREIGERSGLNSREMENVIIAAWFHDTGYAECIENHEEESVKIMRSALQSWNVSEERINSIAEIILATRMPQQPKNLMCRILCDADLYHLSHPEFVEKSEMLRREINKVCNKRLNRADWMHLSFNFIKEHCYFTEYGKRVLGPRKDAIVRRIRNTFFGETC